MWVKGAILFENESEPKLYKMYLEKITNRFTVTKIFAQKGRSTFSCFLQFPKKAENGQIQKFLKKQNFWRNLQISLF